MALRCSGGKYCNLPVPLVLAAEQLCVLHFAAKVEDECNRMRLETTLQFTPDRLEQASVTIAESGQKLLTASTSGLRLTHELKMRVVNTLLTLINLRENVDAAAIRQSQVRSVHAL